MLETGLCVALIARQLGSQILPDQVEAGFKKDDISNERQFEEYFERLGVVTRFRRASVRDLEQRSYIFPCVALMKSGRALVLAGLKPGERGEPSILIGVDPLDPTGKPHPMELDSFRSNWSRRLILVAKKTGEEAKDRFFGWLWFMPEIARFKWLLVVIFLISIILNLLAFAPIIFIQIALDKVIGYKAVSTLYVLTAGVLLAVLFNGALGYVRDHLIRYIAGTIEARLAGDVFDKLLGLPVQSFQGSGASDLERGVLGTGTLRNFLAQQVLTRLFDLTAILVYLPILFAYSLPLGLLVVAFAVAMGTTSLAFKTVEKARLQEFGNKGGAKARILRETIKGIDAVKTLSQESTQRREWRRAAAAAISKQGERESISTVAAQTNTVLQQAMTVGIIVTGVHLVLGGGMSAGALIAVNMIGARVVRPIVQAISMVAELDRVRNVKEQIARIWNAAPERRGFGVQRSVHGHYVLTHVSVIYGDNVRALDNVTLTLDPRRFIGVVGRAGAGKSTILRLLQGLERATEGSMEVDGTPFVNLDIEHYRKQVALVTAQPQFFAGTIEENLRRARPNISEREMEDALRLSALAKVIHDIPDGLAAKIDDQASSLPSGFRLLLAIARALVADPKVLLFDDTFSMLDKELKLTVRNNLPAIAKQRGLIMVTHDLNLASMFDSIVVLDNGKLAGHGPHEELLGACPTYRRLWDVDQQLRADVTKAAE